MLSLHWSSAHSLQYCFQLRISYFFELKATSSFHIWMKVFISYQFFNIFSSIARFILLHLFSQSSPSSSFSSSSEFAYHFPIVNQNPHGAYCCIICFRNSCLLGNCFRGRITKVIATSDPRNKRNNANKNCLSQSEFGLKIVFVLFFCILSFFVVVKCKRFQL